METEFNEKVQHVLRQLDSENDEHWTGEGVPAMSAVHEIAGDSGITRANLLDAAPLYTRENRTFELPPEPKPEDPNDPPVVETPETDPDPETSQPSNASSPETETEAELFKRLTEAKNNVDNFVEVGSIDDESELEPELPLMEDYDRLISTLNDRVTAWREEADRLTTKAKGIEPQIDRLIRAKDLAYPSMSKGDKYQEHLRLHKEHDAKAAALRAKDPLAALAAHGNPHLSPIDAAARASVGENRGMRSQNYIAPKV